MSRLTLGFLASHGGSNMAAIADACASGVIDAQPGVVVSNNSGSMALQRAREAGIPTAHLSLATHESSQALDAAMLSVLTSYGVDLVILAGYMKRIGPETLRHFTGRILNVHPALLPQFGGQGFFGERVHRAVLDAGVSESGATVHLVDEEYDRGAILDQRKVPVLPDDTVTELAKRVLRVEHALYVDVVRRIANGDLVLSR